jgi:hypothetical protein
MAPAVGPAQTRQVGVISTLVGNARLTRGGEQARSLAVKDPVYAGDRIATDEPTTLRVLVGRAALATLQGRSVLTIDGDATPRTLLTFTGGHLVYTVLRERMRPGETHQIRTPNAVVAVNGTIVAIDVQEAAESRAVATEVCVRRGVVTAGALAGATIALQSGQCVTVTGDARGPIRPSRPPRRDDSNIGLLAPDLEWTSRAVTC